MVEMLLAEPAIAPPRDVTLPSGVQLAALAEGHILTAMARTGADVSAAGVAALGDGAAHAVRPLGPGQWLIVGDAVLSGATVRAKAEQWADRASLFDASHARVRISLSGSGAVDLIASGVGLDLRDHAFPVGSSAPTLFRHIAVHLTRTGPMSYELIVARSFAQSLWDELKH